VNIKLLRTLLSQDGRINSPSDFWQDVPVRPRVPSGRPKRCGKIPKIHFLFERHRDSQPVLLKRMRDTASRLKAGLKNKQSGIQDILLDKTNPFS